MQVNQLQHELSKKDELLRIVSIASEESETDSSCSTPLRFNESLSLSQGLLQLDMLQEKLRELEEENMALRSKVRLASLPITATWSGLGNTEKKYISVSAVPLAVVGLAEKRVGAGRQTREYQCCVPIVCG